MHLKTALICLIFIQAPFALARRGDSPVAKGLGWIISEMYGSTGVAITTLAIMSIGLLCLGRYVEWKWLLYTVGGVAIIFGSGAIVSGIQSFIV